MRPLILALTTLFYATPSLVAAEDPLSFRGSLTWTNAYIQTKALESVLNPDNRVLRLPSRELVSEIRPDLKLSTSALQLIVRPRVRYTLSTTEVTGTKDETKGRVEDEVNEAYGQWVVSDALTFAYGRQSYQWGAAESMSPSNRIFHDVAQARDVLYSARGKHLARANFTLGKSFSTVIMAETEASEDESLRPFIADRDFAAIGLVKPELSWNHGADYVGLVVGGREDERGWIGQYFNIGLPFLEGLSLYGDAAQQRGSGAWYPVEHVVPTPTGPESLIAFERSHAEDKSVRTLAVGGLRYDFEGGSAIRAEYIANDAGYSQEERQRALKAFAATSPAQQMSFADNARRFLSPGLEAPGRRYVYVSWFAPDAFDVRDLTLYIRASRSLTDGSTAAYGSAEYATGDAGRLILALSGTAGDTDDELKGYAAPTQTLAYSHSW